MIKVLLEAPILTQSGYGEHARLVFRSLKQQDNLQIFINPLEWGATTWASSVPQPEREEIQTAINSLTNYIQASKNQKIQPHFDVQVHVGIPNEFEKKAPFSVCVTAGIETDRVSPNWLIKTHQGLDKLIVPSEHAKSGFTGTSYQLVNSKTSEETLISCNAEVDVIPYPYKEHEIDNLDINLDTDFNFLSIALLGPRKNLENTIKWFIEEFRDDNVGLILKTGRSKGSNIDRDFTRRHLKEILKNYPSESRKCKVYLLHGNLTEAEIHSLYKRDDIHAYINLAHGEGYGLPIFEAAYSGLPIIATDWSGHLDFLSAPYKEGGKTKTKKLFAKVDYELQEIPKHVVWQDILVEGSKWAVPNNASFKKQLRNVYKNHGMYKKWSKSLQSHICENYQFDNITEKLRRSILEPVGLFEEKAGDNLDLEEAREEALKIDNVKERASFAKEVLKRDISQIEKLSFLKDLFKGEKAVLLSCGPTLTEHEPEKIKDLLKDNLGIAIKQSYQMFEDLIDLHLYNCGNFKKYDYSSNKPIVIEASTSPRRLGECDIKFFIREREFSNSIASTKDFDSWTFDKQPLLRPYGPGIMYEVVFYALQHLGVSDIITIGWDNKHIEGNMGQQHFYDKINSGLDKSDFIDNNEVAQNSEAVATLSLEGKITTDAILDWSNWLNKNGINLTIVSSISPAPESIKRDTI
jgi:glycosyltransferase involved in cell wall biosynthesis